MYRFVVVGVCVCVQIVFVCRSMWVFGCGCGWTGCFAEWMHVPFETIMSVM